MPNSIAVFGTGPGLGQAVARRYAREGFAVTLVARRREPLDVLAKDLTSAGATAHVITADLSDTGATPRLAEQIRAQAGNLDAFYYAPTPDTGFVSAANLTPQHAQNFMPLIFYTMLALVQEFLPHMLEQGDGAILTAQGGSTVRGLPNMSGPSPAQAAQRNYLQALHAEVAEKGVYVGMLYAAASLRWRPAGTMRSRVVTTTAMGTSTWLIQLCEVNSHTASTADRAVRSGVRRSWARAGDEYARGLTRRASEDARVTRACGRS